MPTRKLPGKNSPELQEVRIEYKEAAQRGDIAELNRLALKWKYANRETFERAMRMHTGVYIGQMPTQPQTANTIGLQEIEQKVLDIVKKRPTSVGELSRTVDRSSETIIKVLDSLREKHYMVELDKVSRLVELPLEPQKSFVPTEFKYFHRSYKIGLVSDTHLGSKYQQLTLLHDAYKIFDDRDVDVIFHSGDLVDGTGMYREHVQESFLHTASEQRAYTEENYPRPEKKGLKTHLIGGQHDRSFYKREGYDILEHIAEHRADIVYYGFFSHEFLFNGLPVRMEHPGGGLAYARSYSAQKIVENMMGYINTIPAAIKPTLLLMGHWHTPLHLPVYMGVDTVCLPCFQAQTPYMQQRKNMMPTIGCAIAELWLNEDNQISSNKIEFITMNDKIKDRDW